MYVALVYHRLRVEASPGVSGNSGLPRSVDEVISSRPMGEQISGFHIVDSDVHVSEGLWEKVVNLSRHIKNVANAEKYRKTCIRPTTVTQPNTMNSLI